MNYLIKIVLSSLIIVIVSEIAKRSSFWAGILASLPLTSLLAFLFLYYETKDLKQVSNLSWSILFSIVPTFVLFILFPLLLQYGFRFYQSLLISIGTTSIVYFIYFYLLKKFQILNRFIHD